LRERKFCATGEKKQANDDTSAPDMRRRVCGGTAQPARSCPLGGKYAAPWHRRSASHFWFQVPCRSLKILVPMKTYPSRHVDLKIIEFVETFGHLGTTASPQDKIRHSIADLAGMNESGNQGRKTSTADYPQI
jgi:hypothetical protein